MRSPLPGDDIPQVEAAAHIVIRTRIADKQAGLRDVDCGRPHSKTSRAVALLRLSFIGAAEEVRKAEIVDQCRAKHAAEAQQALVHPSPLASPLRRIRC